MVHIPAKNVAAHLVSIKNNNSGEPTGIAVRLTRPKSNLITPDDRHQRRTHAAVALGAIRWSAVRIRSRRATFKTFCNARRDRTVQRPQLGYQRAVR